MASYGKMMLNAALKNVKAQTSQIDDCDPIQNHGRDPIRCLRPPSSQVKNLKKVEEWLSSPCVPPEEEESADYSSGSEYEPSECLESDQKSVYVPESVCSEQSVIYPMLQHKQQQASTDEELNGSANQMEIACTTVDAADAGLKTPFPSQLRKASKRVKVAGDPRFGSKRNYRKPDYCLFCKGMYMSKISADYLSIHAKESRVKDIMEMPTGSKERKRLLTLLQNEGNHQHNCKTKVARALIALENGQMSKFSGRTLASCTLKELPVVEEEDDFDQVPDNSELRIDVNENIELNENEVTSTTEDSDREKNKSDKRQRSEREKDIKVKRFKHDCSKSDASVTGPENSGAHTGF